MSQEKEIWSGTPSQVVNMKAFIFTGLFFWLIFPLFIMFWKWLAVKNTKYELTTQRLKTCHGVFSLKKDEIELYRVKDYKLSRPFFLRLFGLGTITLETSDRSHPEINVWAVKNPENLREEFRTHVEACRDRKRVREFD